MDVNATNMVASICNLSGADIDILGSTEVWSDLQELGIFFSAKYIKGESFLFTRMLANGTASAKNTKDEDMTASDAINWLNQLHNSVLDKDFTDTSIQVIHNTELGKWFISVVRSEMLIEGLSQHGISAASMATKLQNVIMLLSVGMLEEAGDALSAIVRDGFLTNERVTRYVGYLVQANTIPVVP